MIMTYTNESGSGPCGPPGYRSKCSDSGEFKLGYGNSADGPRYGSSKNGEPGYGMIKQGYLPHMRNSGGSDYGEVGSFQDPDFARMLYETLMDKASKIYASDPIKRLRTYSKINFIMEWSQNYNHGEFANTDGEFVRSNAKNMEWQQYIERMPKTQALLVQLIHELGHVENMDLTEGQNRGKVQRYLLELGIDSGLHKGYLH